MDFAKPQLEVFGLQASFDDLCCGVPTRNQAWFPSSRRGSSGACAPALHRPGRSSGRLDLVSWLRMETFCDRCRVASGLTGNVTAELSNTLDTADVVLDLHVSASAQLGDLPDGSGL